MKRWPPHPVRALLANASLRVRVTVAAAILVTVTSAVMGLLGTTLLRGYLMNRIDTQLRSFGAAAPRILDRPPPGKGPRLDRPKLPATFVMETIAADGKVQLAPGSVHIVPLPRLTTAQLHDPAGPFTDSATGDPGHLWRVVVRPLPGGAFRGHRDEPR